jgi:hypothetical protein
MPVDTELNLAKSDAAASAAAGQTVLDGQDHVTAAVRAVAAASAATPSPAKPKKVSRADEIEQKEVDHLGLIAMTVRSSALRRLIYKGIDLKKEAQALWVPHGEADERSRDLRVSGATKEEMKAAELDEVATWAAWEGKRREVEAVASEVANAPFADLHDVLARARAAGLLIGANGDEEECLPEFEGDLLVILRSYRSAIEEMIARIPDREEWDETVIALRENEKALSEANREWEAAGFSSVGFREDEHPELKAKTAQLYENRDRYRTKLLSLDPPDIEGLLALMDVVFDHAGHVDVSTYERRAYIMGDRPVIEKEQWGDENGSHARSFALVAYHAARLRDASKPRDWSVAMRDLGGLHPNAKDAVHQAYEAGLDLADLKNIQLAGQPEENLPTLLFSGRDGQFWARPNSVWKGHMVNRDGALLMAAEGGELVK